MVEADQADETQRPHRFDAVLRAERQEIMRRRTAARVKHPLSMSHVQPQQLTGLALSGGGIRSATTCLGVLQALNKLGLLRVFDYMSTVSGGGFVGGWWSAWLSREYEVTLNSLPSDFKLPPDSPLNWNQHRRILSYRGRMSAMEQESLAKLVDDPAWRDAVKLIYHMSNSESGVLFPPPERIEPERGPAVLGGRVRLEGARYAYRDPIHHLRLFANYLTPRRGLFSADTWRAIASITRNLILTWMVLLPICLAAILLARVPFVMMNHPTITSILMVVAWLVCIPLLAFLVQTLVWLALSGSSHTLAQTFIAIVSVTLAAAYIAVYLVTPLTISAGKDGLAGISIITGVLIGFAGMIWAVLPSGLPPPEKGYRAEQRRAALTVMQLQMLRVTLVLAVVLLVAGLGPPLVKAAHEGLKGWLLNAGGTIAAVSGLFAAWRAFPRGGADVRQGSEPGRWASAVLTVAPFAFFLLLALLGAWLAETLIYSLEANYKLTDFAPRSISTGFLAGAAICLSYAVLEIDARAFRHRRLRETFAIVIVMVLVWIAASISWLGVAGGLHWIEVIIPGLCVVPVIVLLCLRCRHGIRLEQTPPRNHLTRSVLLLIPAGVVGAGIGTLLHFQGALVWGNLFLRSRLAMYSVCLAGTVLAATLLVCSRKLHNGVISKRSTGLLTGIGTAMALILLVPFASSVLGLDHVQQRLHLTLCLAGICLVAAVALGWTIDPNAISMHSFYRARLIRSYLGASNSRREARAANSDIRDMIPGDDIELSALDNCTWGAPYHLINTTLNLAGARDLASSQRYAAPYVLSKAYCGSQRTGFRRTSEYMNGWLRLGTALAVSGAAASPNMGSRTPDSGMAALMGFFNIRLGYWAANPALNHWADPSMRLWPFYGILDTFSRTRADLPYCYLTDGGHFDNSGVYSLIERGCRYIMLCDCGADPLPCFQDIGELIRRARIDFNAEIELNIEPFLRGSDCRQPIVVGTIHYDRRHLTAVGIRGDYENATTGTIVWFKPSMSSSDLPADVKQYGLANGQFPQQTTTDQWFDEAQFESYRKLAETTILNALRPVVPPWDPSKSISLAHIADLFAAIEARYRPGVATADAATDNSSGTDQLH